MKTILLLGSGELGKEFCISAKRLGCRVIAADRYPNAPAMSVSDESEVFDMLDAEALDSVVRKYTPDFIVPEIEAIRTEKLIELEKEGFQVIPSAKATWLTMNRVAIRDLAANKLKLKTAKFAYATNLDELKGAMKEIGFPAVIKPVMSSSGKGQSVVKKKADLETSWNYAMESMRGDEQKIIVEEFVEFDFEITLLTVKQWEDKTVYVQPIGHVQVDGDYRESWIPAKMKPKLLKKAQKMAKKVTDELGGAGLFGVEFFITKDEVYFSELSPRPHDTGMVTMISQDLSEFDLHIRAILGLPIPKIHYYGPSASAVVLADRDANQVTFKNVATALKESHSQVRIFGKPTSRPNRRMGVALARSKSVKAARKKALKAAQSIQLEYGDQHSNH